MYILALLFGLGTFYVEISFNMGDIMTICVLVELMIMFYVLYTCLCDTQQKSTLDLEAIGW